jgi:GAG-pre-integrase domain
MVEEGKKKTGGYNRARPSVNMIQSNRATETARITEPSPKFSEEKQGEAAVGANQQQHGFSLIPAVSNHTHLGEGNLSIGTNKKSEWIIDSGASDHMTYDQNDFCGLVTPRRLEIINANGEKHPVTGAGRVSLTPSISLSNTLLVPSLSSKLLSVGQISDDLNCIVLMYPRFCLFQDAHTKEILGRGTRRGKLYVMEDISEGRVHHVKSREITSYQIIKWHKRLGHPSFGYMRKLIPGIFEKCDKESFDCTTCIKAKNHRVSFQRNDNISIEPFSLVHSDV